MDNRFYDLVSLGEIMLRMDPGVFPVSHSRKFSVYEGGAEYNVAKSLACVFKKKSAVVTAIVDNPLGKLLHSLILSARVDDRYILWKDFDGLGWRYRNPLNFTDRGFGPRSAVSCSDRGHSVCSLLQDWSVDWKEIFQKRGTKIFHTGGIFIALSEHTYRLSLDAIKHAKECGVLISFDLNFRDSLWKDRITQIHLHQRLQTILPQVDFVFGNESEYFLPVLPGEVLNRKPQLQKDLQDSFLKKRMQDVMKFYPNIRYSCVNIREAFSMSVNNWRGLLCHNQTIYESVRMDSMHIYDRIGSGDAFSSGILYGFLQNFSPKEMLSYGVAHGALCMSTPGDTSMVDLDQVKKVALSQSDIRILR